LAGEVDLLAVGAHPDDAEIGCGGALVLAVRAGLRVAVADLTRGEAATLGTPELRDAERARASEILGLATRPCLGLPDTAVGTDPAHRDAVVELVREARPRVVLAPLPHDRHPDHGAAGRLVQEACYLAGLPAVGQGRPHRPDKLYHYLLHHSVEVSFVVDVTAAWERKLEAVGAYASQFSAADADEAAIDVGRFLEVLEARASVLGAMIGARWGEGFVSTGPVALAGVPGFDLERPRRGYQLFG
jgi:bacillithiol biosynthesis deacetylase BshB1